MSVRISSRGTYQLFRNTQGRQVLSIDGCHLEFTHGNRGIIVARRITDGDIDTVLDSGRFRLVEFESDHRWHHRLMLERQGDFRILLFPEGLPDETDQEVVCRISEEVVGVDEVDTYVCSLRSATAAYQRDHSEDLSRFRKMRSLLKKLKFPATRQQVVDAARRREADEAVTTILQIIDDRNYCSIDDILETIDEIQRFHRLTGNQLSPSHMTALIESMEPAELHALEEYERRTHRRDEILQAIIRRRERKQRQ